MLPFHEWKESIKQREALKGLVHPKEWYWVKYGLYCAKQQQVLNKRKAKS